MLRCLRKDPARRFHHMADVKVELEEVEELSQSRTSVGAWKPRRNIVLVVLAAMFSASVAGVGFVLLRPKSPPARSAVAVPLTSYPGMEESGSFSPDASQFAFSWNGDKQDNKDIYVRMIGSGLPFRLTTDPSDDESPVWSPDGQEIAFWRLPKTGERGIYVISPLGGQERKVLGVPEYSNATSMSWSPDSRWLAVTVGKRSERDLRFIGVNEGSQRSFPLRNATDVEFSPKGDALLSRNASAPGIVTCSYSRCQPI